MKSRYTLPLLSVMTGINDWPLPLFGTPRENPWGPPSAKPEHLRDAEDNRKLRLAQERRERKAKR